jgi:hypothetical protein
MKGERRGTRAPLRSVIQKTMHKKGMCVRSCCSYETLTGVGDDGRHFLPPHEVLRLLHVQRVDVPRLSLVSRGEGQREWFKGQ